MAIVPDVSTQTTVLKPFLPIIDMGTLTGGGAGTDSGISGTQRDIETIPVSELISESKKALSSGGSGGSGDSVPPSRPSGSGSAPGGGGGVVGVVGGGGIPCAPGPSCEPGAESLYKVATAEGMEYVYAPPGASSQQIEDLVGSPGMVTVVHSPDFYGGVYPESKLVTTVDGRQVIVPWKASYDPKPQDNPVVQEIADRAGINYRSAEAELRSIVNYVEKAMVGGSCGPFGITEDQASLVVRYYESMGEQAKADRLAEFYVKTGHPESSLKRASVVGYGTYGSLEGYREEGTDKYDFAQAYIDGVVDEVGLRAMGLPDSYIAGVVSYGSLVKALGPGDLTVESVGRSLAAGDITESQIRDFFPDYANEIVELSKLYPQGIFAKAFLSGYPVTDYAKILWTTQTTMPGGPMGQRWITPIEIRALEGALGRAPTRGEFVNAFSGIPGGVPLSFMVPDVSSLYSGLYPQYTGPKYTAIEVGAMSFPAVKALYPQVGARGITPLEWAMTGVNVALMGRGIYSGLSALPRSAGYTGFRAMAGDILASQRGGGFTIGPRGLGFSRTVPLLQAHGLLYEPVGTGLKSIGPTQRFLLGEVREGPVTAAEITGYPLRALIEPGGTRIPLSNIVGFRPIVGIPVAGEMGLGSFQWQTTLGPGSGPRSYLGTFRASPELQRISPSGFSVSGGMRLNFPGFTGPGVGIFGPEIPITPLLSRGFGGRVGGPPLRPLLGSPGTSVGPRTAVSIAEAYPLEKVATWGGADVFAPKILPTVFPSPDFTPWVSPLLAPYISPVVSPTTKVKSLTLPAYLTRPLYYTGPSPVPLPLPLPSPVVTPIPTPTVVTPTPVKPRPRFPFFWPQFGGSLRRGKGFGMGRKGILGVGAWRFSGFPVSGPHPLELRTAGYSFMGGVEAPYGVGEKLPKVRVKKQKLSGGLVRMV